ncbi:hypothetical protein RD792_017016 [Penstemon davidsonii]|uniref:CCHC-type domain-containing protein n=1 Tax=Penstemon davidsonii TaxID=160366 RepID=A0ABR0CKV0_9LAMI|nr:hypothetical protein RD792_017016 [Penstemon davidsonii]
MKNKYDNASTSNPTSYSHESKDNYKSKLMCYNCRKLGHFIKDCPYPKAEKYTEEEKKVRKERRHQKSKVLLPEAEKIAAIYSSDSDSETSEDDAAEEETHALLCLMAKESDNSDNEVTISENENELFSSFEQMMKNNSNVVDAFAKLKEEMIVLKKQNSLLKLKVEKPQESAEYKQLAHENESLKAECEVYKGKIMELEKIISTYDKSFVASVNTPSEQKLPLLKESLELNRTEKFISADNSNVILYVQTTKPISQEKEKKEKKSPKAKKVRTKPKKQRNHRNDNAWYGNESYYVQPEYSSYYVAPHYPPYYVAYPAHHPMHAYPAYHASYPTYEHYSNHNDYHDNMLTENYDAPRLTKAPPNSRSLRKEEYVPIILPDLNQADNSSAVHNQSTDCLTYELQTADRPETVQQTTTETPTVLQDQSRGQHPDLQRDLRWLRDHPPDLVIGDPLDRVRTRRTFYGSRRRDSRSHSGHSPKILYGEHHPILQSSGLQHWFKNWQHLRKNKLTASTFGLAVGFWPGGRVKLWLEKLGAIEPFSGNLATCWSNIKEEEALERYKLITGNTISYPEFQVKKNPEDSWLGASPDGTIESLIYGLPSRGVLEIKCPFFNGDIKTSAPWKRVPMYYIPQAQGLMEILDRDWMDFYCWTVNGSSLFRLYRDEEYWDILKISLSDFWWKHVQPAKELCSKSGCIELLSRSGISIKGKNAVVVGRSNIVGLPVFLLLLKEDATIKPGAAVIDVGTNAVDDSSKKSGYRLVGDVDFHEACKVAGWITPVPGGVGPMTVAMLLKNTLDGAKRVIH